jgi:hypothetical protein
MGRCAAYSLQQINFLGVCCELCIISRKIEKIAKDIFVDYIKFVF